MTKTETILHYLQETYQPRAIIVYGSFADGSAAEIENCFYASDLSDNFVAMIDRIFEGQAEKASPGEQRQNSEKHADNQKRGRGGAEILVAVGALYVNTGRGAAGFLRRLRGFPGGRQLRRLRFRRLPRSGASGLLRRLFALRGDTPIDKHQPSRRRRERMRKAEH